MTQQNTQVRIIEAKSRFHCNHCFALHHQPPLPVSIHSAHLSEPIWLSPSGLSSSTNTDTVGQRKEHKQVI